MEHEKIDIGDNLEAEAWDNYIAIHGAGDYPAFIYKGSARNLTELFRKQGWLEEKDKPAEYGVIEISNFDDLREGDGFANCEDVTVNRIVSDPNSESVYAVLSNDLCIDTMHVSLFRPLKVRRKAEPLVCVATCKLDSAACIGGPWLSGFKTRDILNRAGFKPGDEVEVTVKKVNK